MIKLNNVCLDNLINSNSIKITNARKNEYVSIFGTVNSSSRLPGNIKINASLKYENDAELIANLNQLENSLENGYLEIDDKKYEVKILQGLYQGIDLENINLVFSWDGYIIKNKSKIDLSL